MSEGAQLAAAFAAQIIPSLPELLRDARQEKPDLSDAELVEYVIDVCWGVVMDTMNVQLATAAEIFKATVRIVASKEVCGG